jgi:N-methylhydantoinase B
MQVTSRDGSKKALGVNRFYDVARGDVFELHSQGGGGFGDPLDRALNLVRQDVVNGYVTVESAWVDYGVVLDDGHGEPKINEQATAQERSRRSSVEVSRGS